MKVFCLTFLFVFIASLSFSYAQDQDKGTVLSNEGIVSSDLKCFSLVNRAPYTVHGTIITDYYTTQSGVSARHRENFRLETNESNEYCAAGPFFGEDKDQLKLVIRTIVPIFSCNFKAKGEIAIRGEVLKEGGTKTWAECNQV
jgi:hypothetical protein